MNSADIQDVFIASIARTPLGSFGGKLMSFTAPQLGSITIQAALERSGIDKARVDEVFFGHVLGANVGQNPARQAALGAGLSTSVPCTTVNKVCASGMKAFVIGAQSIALGHAQVVVVGGMESMSNCPYYVPKARFGSKFGHQQLVDGCVQDGLWDVYNNYVMGNAAEECARKYEFTREQQDDFAIESYERLQKATANGLFADEIVKVKVAGARGKADTFVECDEEGGNLNIEKLRAVKAAFVDNGTVTAPNSSPLSDGAAALVLISGSRAKELGIKVIARVCGYADAAKDPKWFTMAPSLAIPKAVAKAGLKMSDVDYFEINEAFAVVALGNMKELNLDAGRVNVFGGAVAMGHPLGCSGARIIATLISVLKHKKARVGCAGVCNGGGGASSVVIEMLENA